MVNYNNGKIYKIEDLAGEMCYIGSTTKHYLSKRMVQHRAMYKRWQEVDGAKNISVFRIFEKYGMDYCRIILVELCPCNTRDELLKREAYHMKLFECVNKTRPILTEEEKLEYQKAYHEKNRDKLNTDASTYYKENKVSINTRLAIKTTCGCGTTHRLADYLRHARSGKHINYLDNQIIAV